MQTLTDILAVLSLAALAPVVALLEALVVVLSLINLVINEIL